MGSTAIRSAVAFPGFAAVGRHHVVAGSKTGRDAATFARLDAETGVTATTDVDAALAGCDAVAYMASGDIRPEEAVADIERCLRAGSMWSRRRCTRSTTRGPAPQEWVERLTAAAEEGGASLLVSGVDPGWGNDALAVIAAGLCTRIRSIHCQEIFDYSTYNQPYAVKVSCGFGRPMDEDPSDDAAAVRSRRWCGAATSG